MVKKGAEREKKRRGGEEEGNNERHGKNMRPRGQGGKGEGGRPQTCCDRSVSLEDGEMTEERERQREEDQYASQSHRGAAG